MRSRVVTLEVFRTRLRETNGSHRRITLSAIAIRLRDLPYSSVSCTCGRISDDETYMARGLLLAGTGQARRGAQLCGEFFATQRQSASTCPERQGAAFSP